MKKSVFMTINTAILVSMIGGGSSQSMAQLATAPTQGGVSPVYTSNTASLPLAAGGISSSNAGNAMNVSNSSTLSGTPGATLPGTIEPMPNPYTHQANAANQDAVSSTTVVKPAMPNEGEIGKDGKIVHYEMAGKDPNTGTGILRNVQLPKRSFGDVDN